MAWNPETYNKFKAERYAPFFDLFELIEVKTNLSVIDLGCGTGELTSMLADKLPASKVLGIDSSDEMLKESAKYKKDNLSFSQIGIEEIVNSGKQWDIVFSNAAIQWVKNHTKLIPALIKLVKPGGQMAIQLPSNHNHFTHTAIKTIASSSPFKEALKGWTRTSPVLGIEEYAEILYKQRVTSINVFEKIYPHVLDDANGMVTWVSGTALIPYLERLPENMHNDFMAKYSELIAKKFPGKPVFYPFKRTFIYGEVKQ